MTCLDQPLCNCIFSTCPFSRQTTKIFHATVSSSIIKLQLFTYSDVALKLYDFLLSIQGPTPTLPFINLHVLRFIGRNVITRDCPMLASIRVRRYCFEILAREKSFSYKCDRIKINDLLSNIILEYKFLFRKSGDGCQTAQYPYSRPTPKIRPQ